MTPFRPTVWALCAGLLAGAAILAPAAATADVLSARFGGYEDCTSYGNGGGSSAPAAADVYEALSIHQEVVAPRGGPLVTMRAKYYLDWVHGGALTPVAQPTPPSDRDRGATEQEEGRYGSWRIESLGAIACPPHSQLAGPASPYTPPAASAPPPQAAASQPAAEPANVNCLQYCYAQTSDNPASYLPCANHIPSTLQGTAAQCQADFITATVKHQNVAQ